MVRESKFALILWLLRLLEARERTARARNLFYLLQASDVSETALLVEFYRSGEGLVCWRIESVEGGGRADSVLLHSGKLLKLETTRK